MEEDNSKNISIKRSLFMVSLIFLLGLLGFSITCIIYHLGNKEVVDLGKAATQQAYADDQALFSDVPNHLKCSVIVDNETGVEYIVVYPKGNRNNAVAITPRMSGDSEKPLRSYQAQ